MPCLTDRPARISSLTRSKMTMFASAGDASQRQRDRDQLDQREEVDAVSDQAGDGDHAEQPVIRDQEDHHDPETDEAGDQTLMQRLLTERRRDLAL
jgi:hypothetical protein